MPTTAATVARAQVVLERLLVAEAPAALGAGVGPLARVDALVLHEVVLADEALAAVCAAEGPLARVQPPVVEQVLLAHEALAAVRAGVRPLARVDHLVADQGRVAVEVDATLRAGEGPLLRVAPLVQQQADLQAEAPAALRAAEGPLAGVGSPVAGQARLVGKALGAVGAGEGALGAVVDPKVVGESGRVSESPGAVWAGGWRLAGGRLGAAVGVRGEVPGALGAGGRALPCRAAPVGQQHVLAEALAAVVAREQLLPGRRREGVAAQLSESHLSLRGFGQVGGWTSKRRHGRRLRAFEGHVRKRILSCCCRRRREGDGHLGAQGGSGEAFSFDDKLFV